MEVTEGQATLELVVDAHATVGESPVWDVARNVLWWVDIPAGVVHRFDPVACSDDAISLGCAVGSVGLRRDGNLLAALTDQLAVLEPDGGRLDSVVSFARTDRPLISNDGKCDPMGRFLVGRMAPDGAAGAGALLSIDSDLTVAARLTGLASPNGLGWSLDGQSMYFVDSARPEICEYPYELATGAIGEARVLVAFPDRGVPDGLSVDGEGALWVAIWSAGCVVRVSPDGDVVSRVELPVAQVTSCSFGGEDLGDLYITTANEGLSPAALALQPCAGGLFRCRPGVPGQPPVRFAG